MEFSHTTVLLNETVDSLNINPSGIYVDATMGGGGHSSLILSKLEDGILYAFDQDKDAVENGKNKFKDNNKIRIINDNFSNIKYRLQELGVSKIDGIIADLGVSSYQLDNPERGFSYSYDAPLDMRMDMSAKLDAYTVVNTYSLEDLDYIIKEYSQENWSKQIARVICDQRKIKPIKTTFDLVDVIEKAVPKKMRDKNKHVARRTFQAIRIEVNKELEILEEFIKDSVELLNKDGIISIITFHSLEDKIIKNTFKELAQGCICPKEFPVCVCNNKPKIKILNRKPILPSQEEIMNNPRSRSAKLRTAMKL